jgi:hypothetical protein
MLASTTLPLDAGVYRLGARADGGVRIIVDGSTVVEHRRTGDPDASAVFSVESQREVDIVVQYFKAGGRGSLGFELEPAFLDTIRQPRP